MNAQEKAEELAGGHFVLDEDCWYSCPKSGESCRDDADTLPCDCGREERAEKIRAALEEAAKRCPDLAAMEAIVEILRGEEHEGLSLYETATALLGELTLYRAREEELEVQGE